MYQLEAPHLGAWRAGNTGVEGVWRFVAPRPGPRVAVTALVHGNELCGAWVLQELLEAGVRPVRGSLTLAFCNLAAFDTFDANRPDAARFVQEDFNRQWALERLQDAGTAERRRAAQLRPFLAGCEALLDLHSMHEPGPPLLLAGPHRRNISFAAAMGGGRHIVVDGGHAEGTRMRDFGPFGLPDEDPAAARAVLVECGYHGDLATLAVARDACVRFLGLTGALDAGVAQRLLPDWRQPDQGPPEVLAVEGAVVARSEHFRFTQPFPSIAPIPKAGSVIADDAGDPVVTPFDDCVLVMPSSRHARAGVTVVRFARSFAVAEALAQA
jgi:hypothetical protein